MLNAIWSTFANLELDIDSMKAAIDTLLAGNTGFFNSLFSTIAGLFNKATSN